MEAAWKLLKKLFPVLNQKPARAGMGEGLMNRDGQKVYWQFDVSEIQKADTMEEIIAAQGCTCCPI